MKSQFRNTDLSLWPNQFVNVRLFLSVRKDALVVPTATIQNGTQGSFVYVVGSDSKAEARPVQIDFAEGNLSVIRSGLQAGDQVVFDGQDKLQPGARVTPHPTNLNTGVASNGANPPADWKLRRIPEPRAVAGRVVAVASVELGVAERPTGSQP